MKKITLADASPELKRFLANVPSVDSIRNRLAQHKHEVAFLRRLLKLAVDAEQAGKGVSNA